MSKIRNRFREVRLAMGSTALKIATEVGVREGTYLKWERLEAIPSAQYVIPLERALGKKWAELWTSEE